MSKRVNRLLTGEDLRLTYGSDHALAGASLTVQPGESIGVVGRSGSGKTSLLLCLAGIVRPSGGRVAFRGTRIDDGSDEERSALRRTSFGFVFQFGELAPELSLLENVSMPLRFAGVRRAPAERRAREAMGDVGIAELAQRRPGQVSGGQVQRAAVARALVHEPAVIFADEPTGALDADSGQKVLALLLDQARVRGSSVLLVTHDSTVASAADRTVVVTDGRTGAQGVTL
ncbi:ABC transporter ATP-binding protein [Streptomyces sp. NBC_00344]|uniref:ABC transporter ATP-binding protein n=1 Tax=Streptomyces sp. NBC_00344 TaxID=2975720 RepID=UPI002E204AFB